MTAVTIRLNPSMPTAPQVGSTIAWPRTVQTLPNVENGPLVDVSSSHQNRWSQPCTRAHSGTTATAVARPTATVKSGVHAARASAP